MQAVLVIMACKLYHLYLSDSFLLSYISKVNYLKFQISQACSCVSSFRYLKHERNYLDLILLEESSLYPACYQLVFTPNS